MGDGETIWAYIYIDTAGLGSYVKFICITIYSSCVLFTIKEIIHYVYS